ncbi:nuclear export factor GLE1 [Curtobacterium sp. 'Ferrero']|uniref:YcnI family copper-binding membrane protein n=1 Tax=Curtobacterium sp. 'Ferrero' TaxID=2033654 RepID=UPI000BD9504B|nr:YcnI family protein [Curtobacterium sp. 'Ferrero']PCN47480.1 nuclear export factor GLE1 [Curtobacterium sp. 'Ferrero']
MRKRPAVIGTATLGVTAALVLGTAAAASAHVEATATSTAADSYTTATFSVPHGCDGSPTTKLTFHVPESIIEVTPTVNPNWSITKTTEAYTSPSASSDDESAEDAGQRVTAVTYTAKTPLPADERDTFSLSFSLPDGKAGDRVEFPVTQTCEKGSVEWDQQQEDGKAEPEHPAPSVVLTAAVATEADGDPVESTATTAAAEPATTTSDPDLVGRFLGLGGLVLGAAALVVAVASTRRRTSK